MPNFASEFIKNTLPTASSSAANNVISNDYFVDLTAAQLAVNNIVDIGLLPAGHTVTDMILLPGDLDTSATPTVALDVGMMSGTPGDIVSVRTCGSEFFAADIGARTGAASRMSQATGFLVKASAADRSIGVKIQAAATTAAAGRIRLRVIMHPSDTNLTF